MNVPRWPQRLSRALSLAPTLAACVVLGCTGVIDGAPGADPPSVGTPSQGATPGAGPPRPPGDDPVAPPASPGATSDALLDPRALGPAPVRRHSREELRQTLADLLGVDVRAELELLPNDPISTLFDNNADDMVPSAALLEGLHAVTEAAARRTVETAARLEAVAGCRPARPDDETCMQKLVTGFGRRAWRRSLDAEEITRFTAEGKRIATAAGDFAAGVEVVLRALLQSPQFLYRIELGDVVPASPGLVKLTGYEVATRLSYLLWGSTPGDDLLALAGRGGLTTGADVRKQAQAMLQDRRAVERLRRVHAMWLSYEAIEAPEALASAMRRETDALVDRHTRPATSWLGMFDAGETFVDRALATHYGLPSPGMTAAWVPYGATGRRGLLSHGSVLTNGQKFGKTSIVQRGLFVLRRLMCKDVPDPPNEVDVDEEPKGAKCKLDNLRAHSAQPACAGCHGAIDPIGAGLEGYDLLGRARTRDETDCPVDARGELPVPGGPSLGSYRGPAELGARLVGSGHLGACFVEQWYQFANGRPLLPSDAAPVRALGDRLRARNHDLPELMLDFVSAPAFLHRFTGTN